MTLPNFLIIGAQKSGTTWLANMLGRHPDVFMTSREVHFFNIEENYSKGMAWYEKHFDGSEGRQAIGEKTPNYFWITESASSGKGGTHRPHVHRALYQALPDARIIVVLRNPVDRALSAVNHYIRQGQLPVDSSIDDLLMSSNRRLTERYGVLDMGRYYKHLECLKECYPERQLLVLLFEHDVAESPAKGLRKVCDFLGIDSAFGFPGKDDRIGEYEPRSYWVTRLSYRFPLMRRGLRIFERKAPTILGPLGTKILGSRVRTLQPSRELVQELYEFYAAENEKLAGLIGPLPESWSYGRARGYLSPC